MTPNLLHPNFFEKPDSVLSVQGQIEERLSKLGGDIERLTRQSDFLFKKTDLDSVIQLAEVATQLEEARQEYLAICGNEYVLLGDRKPESSII